MVSETDYKRLRRLRDADLVDDTSYVLGNQRLNEERTKGNDPFEHWARMQGMTKAEALRHTLQENEKARQLAENGGPHSNLAATVLSNAARFFRDLYNRSAEPVTRQEVEQERRTSDFRSF